MDLLVILAIAVVVAAVVALSKRKKDNPTINIPSPPAVARTDLLFGYFGSDDDTPAETIDHCNVAHITGWNSKHPDGEIAQCVLAVQAGFTRIIFSPPDWLHWSNKDNLRRQFTALRAAGVLDKVVALYPMDEPDIKENNMDAAAVAKMVADCKEVQAEFPELANMKYMITYGVNGTPGIELFDWVGRDDYGKTIERAQEIKRMLRPDQKYFVIAGSADPWKEGPEDADRLAQSDPQCMGIFGFTWCSPNPAQPTGARSNGMAERWRAVGRKYK